MPSDKSTQAARTYSCQLRFTDATGTSHMCSSPRHHEGEHACGLCELVFDKTDDDVRVEKASQRKARLAQLRKSAAALAATENSAVVALLGDLLAILEEY